MPTSTVLAITGLLLLSWASAGPKRRPHWYLPALGVFLLGLALRILTPVGLWATATGMMTDMGLALLAAGVYRLIKHAPAKAYMASGFLFLSVSALFNMGSSLVQNAWTALQTDTTEAQALLELGPDDTIDEVLSVLDVHHLRYERAFPGFTLAEDEDLAQYYLLTGPRADLERAMTALRLDTENVDQVDWNVAVHLPQPVDEEPPVVMTEGSFLENDPLVNEQWALEHTGAHELHALLAAMDPAEPAVVAIVDTGVDATHEDIRDVFMESPGRKDANGHGSHCAGIAGAATNNGLGVASLNWENKFIRIQSYQALSASGAGTAESVAQAILDAVRGGADVISLSLGSWSPIPPKVEVDAIKYALAQGAIVVAAAGNSNDDAREHAPSNIPGVITVSALDQQGRKASFSNTNTSLKRPIAAPGVGILSLKTGGGYVPLNGTSMATPFVAGTLGLMRALRPGLTAEQAYQLLHETGSAGPDAGKVGRTVQTARAVEALLGSS